MDYWEQPVAVSNLKDALNFPAIRYCIETICKGESAPINVIERIEIEDIKLRNIFLKEACRKTREPDLYLTFIFHQEYLMQNWTHENMDNNDALLNTDEARYFC